MYLVQFPACSTHLHSSSWGWTLKPKLTEGKQTVRETQEVLEAARGWRQLRVGNSRTLFGNSATSKTPPWPAWASVSQLNIKGAEMKVRIPEARPFQRGPPWLWKLGSSSAKSLTLSLTNLGLSLPIFQEGDSLSMVGSLEDSPPPPGGAPLAPIFPSHCSPQLLLVLPGKRVEVLLKTFPHS